MKILKRETHCEKERKSFLESCHEVPHRFIPNMVGEIAITPTTRTGGSQLVQAQYAKQTHMAWPCRLTSFFPLGDGLTKLVKAKQWRRTEWTVFGGYGQKCKIVFMMVT
jgi:hypothetical protein